MADQPISKPPFWSSLPGMFTGLGAVIVAVTGLITALYTTGVIGSKANPNAAAPANVSAAAPAASPNAESERYKSLAGRWEVVEATSDNSARTTWHYEASVSGNVLTLTGKIFKIGEDKNLTDDEERMAGTFVMTGGWRSTGRLAGSVPVALPTVTGSLAGKDFSMALSSFLS